MCAQRSHSTPRELMLRNTDPRLTRFKPSLRVAATRTRSYKRIRRTLINRCGSVGYIRVVYRQRRNAMLLTKVERAADPFSRSSSARPTLTRIGAFRYRPIRNINARCRCPPERMDCLRNGERCKRNDNRTVGRILQRTFFLVRQDGLGFAGCNSDFDPRWPTAPPRRGCLYRRGVGRKLR
jgi:hypothetical protein